LYAFFQENIILSHCHRDVDVTPVPSEHHLISSVTTRHASISRKAGIGRGHAERSAAQANGSPAPDSPLPPAFARPPKIPSHGNAASRRRVCQGRVSSSPERGQSRTFGTCERMKESPGRWNCLPLFNLFLSVCVVNLSLGFPASRLASSRSGRCMPSRLRENPGWVRRLIKGNFRR
jgi:hypothetical protein